METQIVDLMCINALNGYYLWIDDPGRRELIDSCLNPYTCKTPKESLKKVLNTEDRWTVLIEKFSETEESFNGIETTIGGDFTPVLVRDSMVIFVTNFVYNNSPAQQAGLKRGSIILCKNGEYFNIKNYSDFYKQTGTMTLTLGRDVGNVIYRDTTIELTAIKMAEDPILKTEVFDLGSKKVGYIAYDNFTADTLNLMQTMGSFKEAGISEIVLDLRSNGGGYGATAQAWASMLAPVSAVEKGDIFIRNIFNSYVKKLMPEDSHFNKQLVPYNPDLKHVYALVSRYSASASESLLVSLKAYMDVTIIGEPTHGKFCSGFLVNAMDVFSSDFYKKYEQYITDTGIYVMVGTFSDKNGYNGSRPNGFVPDVYQKEDLFDGYQLGDENETMLRVALELAGKTYPSTPTRAAQARPQYEILDRELPVHRSRFVAGDGHMTFNR